LVIPLDCFITHITKLSITCYSAIIMRNDTSYILVS